MNSFGRIFRVSIFGESHGPSVGVVIDGCPAGLKITDEVFADDLARRSGGGKGKTSRVERDSPMIESGVLGGHTTGAPIAIHFANEDADPAAYDAIKDRPRPGHADMAARMKFAGHADHRGGGHFSGRLTVGLVAAGAIAKRIIAPAVVAARVSDEAAVKAAAAKAAAEGDSVGGMMECTADGVPAGLGEPFFDSAESVISHLCFAVPGVKGVEFGAGFKSAGMRGSQYNDAILDSEGRTATNNAGGINGGITNGNRIELMVAFRPTASIAKEQDTVDVGSGERVKISVGGRHDACIALRAPVVVEAAVAIALADLSLMAGASKARGR